MKMKEENNSLILSDYNNFDIKKTFECGQCFRWEQVFENYYIGIIRNKKIEIYQQPDQIIFKNITYEYYKDILEDYFDLTTNYEKINKNLIKYRFIKDACNYGKGIRILKQEPLETLISFIISQNNNIPRIKLIINRLCKKFGQKISNNYYSFPTLEALKSITINDLSELKCGFRDKYIIDAIEKIYNKEIIFNDIYNMETDKARKILMTIKGVGPKVADCVLLYGFHKTDCFPTDVWIKKTMDRYFPKGLPEIEPNYLGITQQYIYFYSRSNPLLISK